MNSFAQKQHFFGKVVDHETYISISDANISFAGTKQGCTSDRNGEFSFYLDSLPVYIVISHLGYETQRIWLDKASGGFTVLLRPVASMLQEVEIKSENKPEPFFKDELYSVFDYEVDSSLVYLLIYRFRLAKSELLCKSLSGDTVARSGTFSFKPAGLFLDCLGYLHVLSQDSAYQVYLEKDTLLLPYAFDIQKFNSTVIDCVAATDDLLVFRNESPDHQTIDFVSINRKTKQKQNLTSVRDEFKVNMLWRNPSDHYFFSFDTIPDGYLDFKEWMWVKKILYTPNVSVLFKAGDTLAVFNTTNGAIELFNVNGKFMSGLAMPAQETGSGDWTKEIYVDRIAHSFYTSFLKNGKLSLCRIDLFTGELKRILVTTHIFPQKVKVHDNNLFYLYDLPGSGDNKHLFKQKIDN
jgi:hypothetical protein